MNRTDCTLMHLLTLLSFLSPVEQKVYILKNIGVQLKS